MKKLLFSVLAITLLLGMESCELSQDITFVVSATDVISSFQEYKSGDFSLDGGEYVQINVFIYNGVGEYVDHEKVLLDSYSENYTFHKTLEPGNYIVVATSNVIGEDNFTHWIFSNARNLYNLKITDSGYIGNEDKVLGLSLVDFTVDNNESVCSINIQPGTAMVKVLFTNIHCFSDVNYLSIRSKKSGNGISFNGNWIYDYLSESDHSYILSYLQPKNYDGENIYSFHALIPGTYAYYGYLEYVDEDDTYFLTTSDINITANAGSQYNFTLDLNEDDIMSLTSVKTKSQSEGDYIKAIQPSREKSYRAIDLLQGSFKHLSSTLE